jgi:hypothetical protein
VSKASSGRRVPHAASSAAAARLTRMRLRMWIARSLTGSPG